MTTVCESGRGGQGGIGGRWKKRGQDGGFPSWQEVGEIGKTMQCCKKKQ